MLVRDRMTPQPLVVVTPDTPIIEAQRLMQERNIWHLPVVAIPPTTDPARCDELVGLLSRTTVLQAVPWSATSLSALETQYILARVKVGKVMIREVVTITEDVPVEEAARSMLDHKIGCLPIMRDGRLVGIISGTDLLATLTEMVGGRRPGLRLSVTVPNVVGSMARLSASIAGIGGNLTVFTSWMGQWGPDRLGVVLKVDNVTQEQLVSAVTPLPGVEVLEVRKG